MACVENFAIESCDWKWVRYFNYSIHELANNYSNRKFLNFLIYSPNFLPLETESLLANEKFQEKKPIPGNY